MCELSICHTHCPQMHRSTGYGHRLMFTGTCAEIDAAFLCMLRVWVFMCRSEGSGNIAMQPVTLTSSLLSWDIQYDPERRLTRRILAHCGLISGSRPGWQLDYVRMQKTSISTARQIELNNCLTSLPSWRIERIKCVSPAFPFSLFRFIALGSEKSSCGNCISAS